EIREIIRMSQLFVLEELTECAKIFAQNELVQRNQGTPQLGLELALLSCLELHRRENGGQTVIASANGSGRMPTSLSTPSSSMQRNAYDNLPHPPTSATPTNLHTPTRQEQAQTPATSGTSLQAQTLSPSSISQTSTHNVPSIAAPEQQP